MNKIKEVKGSYNFSIAEKKDNRVFSIFKDGKALKSNSVRTTLNYDGQEPDIDLIENRHKNGNTQHLYDKKFGLIIKQ